VRLQRELSQRVGRKVDLVTTAALKPQFRDRILQEAVVAA
jgi:predicted nucleotidyltransferase